MKSRVVLQFYPKMAYQERKQLTTKTKLNYGLVKPGKTFFTFFLFKSRNSLMVKRLTCNKLITVQLCFSTFLKLKFITTYSLQFAVL